MVAGTVVGATMGAGVTAARQLLGDIVASNPHTSEAVFMVDVGEVVRKHREFLQRLPRVVPFYAMKCNSDPAILRTLRAMGAGFDCASKAEIEAVVGMGVATDNIIYANPCKAISYLQYAQQVGVRMVTFDNEDELYKIAHYHPGARLVLRILTDDSRSTSALGKKFGAAPDRIAPLLRTAKSLALDVIGVSFHVGSGNYSAEAFRDAVMRARGAFNLAADLGYTFALLDLGGGFPGVDDGSVTFGDIAQVLGEALDAFFPPACGVRIIAEPGRYYATACHQLAVSVIGRRLVHDKPTGLAVERRPSEEDSGVETAGELDGSSDEESPAPAHMSLPVAHPPAPPKPRYMYYLSDGVYGSLNCTVFDHVTLQPHVLSRHGAYATPMDEPTGNARDLFVSSLWGPTCDSIDLVASDVLLPELHVGDWLLLDNMGAYTKGSATRFNGMELACSYYINTEHATTPEVNAALGLAMAPVAQTDLYARL